MRYKEFYYIAYNQFTNHVGFAHKPSAFSMSWYVTKNGLRIYWMFSIKQIIFKIKEKIK